MLQFYLSFNRAVLTERVAEKHLKVEKRGRLICKIETTGYVFVLFVCFLWRCGPMRARASSFLRFLDHTQRRIRVGRTPLGE